VTAGRRLTIRLLTGLVAILGVPRLALACPVCFGVSDSLMATGMNNGVLVLLAVTLGVLASFGAFFICLMRRAKAAQDSPRLSRPVEQGGNG
jgi:hypothetical protein